jgi:hypothetical protein
VCRSRNSSWDEMAAWISVGRARKEEGLDVDLTEAIAYVGVVS